MEYFAGLDVSMEETHVCVVDRDGAVIHEAKVPLYACRHRGRACAGSSLPADRVRDRPNGADALPWLERSSDCRSSASRAGRPIRR